ncbi:MAG: hypothetical protein WAL63_16350 [Solirubrobacteraceae bacterium]
MSPTDGTGWTRSGFRSSCSLTGRLTRGSKRTRPPESAFVSNGIDAAINTARGLAGDRNMGVTAGVIAQQALDAGLLHEIWVMLVPVLLGGGR